MGFDPAISSAPALFAPRPLPTVTRPTWSSDCPPNSPGGTVQLNNTRMYSQPVVTGTGLVASVTSLALNTIDHVIWAALYPASPPTTAYGAIIEMANANTAAPDPLSTMSMVQTGAGSSQLIVTSDTNGTKLSINGGGTGGSTTVSTQVLASGDSLSVSSTFAVSKTASGQANNNNEEGRPFAVLSALTGVNDVVP
jgi:hypothetical protein